MEWKHRLYIAYTFLGIFILLTSTLSLLLVFRMSKPDIWLILPPEERPLHELNNTVLMGAAIGQLIVLAALGILLLRTKPLRNRGSSQG